MNTDIGYISDWLGEYAGHVIDLESGYATDATITIYPVDRPGASPDYYISFGEAAELPDMEDRSISFDPWNESPHILWTKFGCGYDTPCYRGALYATSFDHQRRSRPAQLVGYQWKSPREGSGEPRYKFTATRITEYPCGGTGWYPYAGVLKTNEGNLSLRVDAVETNIRYRIDQEWRYTNFPAYNMLNRWYLGDISDAPPAGYPPIKRIYLDVFETTSATCSDDGLYVEKLAGNYWNSTVNPTSDEPSGTFEVWATS